MAKRFSHLLLSFLVLALVCAVPRPALAQGSQYTAIVPVQDTTEAQRDHAFSVALTQVLGRVAGTDLSAKPGYQDTLGKAANYVQQYQYQRADDGNGFMLQVSFDPGAIRRVIASFGGSSWGGSRPPVLLVVRNGSGQLMGADALAPLTQAAGARGVNFVYPAPGAQLDNSALAQADEHALAAVARRYHTGLVLLGSVDHGSAQWTLVAAGQAQSWQSAPGGMDAALSAAGSTLVSRLTQRFGDGSQGASSQGVLWVEGVGSAEDFAQLIASVRDDALVRSVRAVQAQGPGVALQISARASMSSVADELAAKGRLLPSHDTHAGADVTLHWLH